jgi:ribosome assembly protein YihI (activator of Der GTPase)
MIPIPLADILTTLDRISEMWRSETAVEQRTDLADLDDLLARLDDTEPQTSAEAERIDELRGRIEILMDEIEISLGIEPTPIFTIEDLDIEPPDPRA